MITPPRYYPRRASRPVTRQEIAAGRCCQLCIGAPGGMAPFIPGLTRDPRSCQPIAPARVYRRVTSAPDCRIRFYPCPTCNPKDVIPPEYIPMEEA